MICYCLMLFCCLFDWWWFCDFPLVLVEFIAMLFDLLVFDFISVLYWCLRRLCLLFGFWFVELI